MGPMLKEESFHLGTGANGIRRIVKAGVIPIAFLQKYINKWVSTGLDLFGTDESTSQNGLTSMELRADTTNENHRKRQIGNT